MLIGYMTVVSRLITDYKSVTKPVNNQLYIDDYSTNNGEIIDK